MHEQEAGKAVIVRTDGTRETVDWHPDTLYKLMSGAVGGYIERVVLPKHKIEMYVNDDGYRLNLDINPLASTLYMEEYDDVPPIIGNAIIVGPTDPQGESTTLLPDRISMLHEHTIYDFFKNEEVPPGDLADDDKQFLVHESELAEAAVSETIDPIPGEEDDE